MLLSKISNWGLHHRPDHDSNQLLHIDAGLDIYLKIFVIGETAHHIYPKGCTWQGLLIGIHIQVFVTGKKHHNLN